MATNTKKARREALKTRQDYIDLYHKDFVSLYHNSVEVEKLPIDLPKRYLLKILMEKGSIAYDKETGLYLPFTKIGIDVYGLPTQYSLIGYDGTVLTRNADKVVILRANDIEAPIDDYLYSQIAKLVDFDLSIKQNLDAIKTMTICEVKDEATLLSLANEYEARRIGATVVFKNKSSMEGCETKVSSTGASYLVDKLLEARKEVLNETLSKLGINVANVDKRERVQNGEIRASQGYALDSLSVLIETFNHDAEVGGLDIRLKGNTSLYLLNQLDMEKQEKEIKEGERNNE